MYESYWQLDHKPFENHSDPRFYYPGESHQGALLKLRYAIENRRGGAVLSGGSGTGKTLLIDVLRRQMADAVGAFVRIVFPQMSPGELLAYLADELTSAPDSSASRGVVSLDQSVRRVQIALQGFSARNQHAVIVIDEAHLIDDARTFETLRLLLNFDFDDRAPLTLLLVGQPGLLRALERMPSFEERLGAKCLLRSFDTEETISYVLSRLNAAGAKRDIFETAALESLHPLSHGVPRRINRLCDLALLVGYAQQQPSISAEDLEAVAEDLVTVAAE